MKNFQVVQASLSSLLFILLLGGCAPATDETSYVDREPIYIASVEIPHSLAETSKENCEKDINLLNATRNYLRDGFEAEVRQIDTYCYESSAWRRTIEGQFNRNAKAAGFIPARSSERMVAYGKEGSQQRLATLYRVEGDKIYITVAHAYDENAQVSHKPSKAEEGT